MRALIAACLRWRHRVAAATSAVELGCTTTSLSHTMYLFVFWGRVRRAIALGF